MDRRPEFIFFLLAAGITALGLATDAMLDLLATRVVFTGMFSAIAAGLCGGLLWAAKENRSRLRFTKIAVSVFGVFVALNFMRLAIKWGGNTTSADPRPYFAIAMAFFWIFAIGSMTRVTAESSVSSTEKLNPHIARFGGFASAMVVLVVIFVVRGIHTPTASMARDLLQLDGTSEMELTEQEVMQEVPADEDTATQDEDPLDTIDDNEPSALQTEPPTMAVGIMA